MGRIARVLEFFSKTRRSVTYSQVKSDMGGDDIRSADVFRPLGEDSQPLAEDITFVVPGPRSGQVVSVGFIDPANPTSVEPGGKKIYSRDPGGGVKAFVELKPDGEINIETGISVINAKEDGNIQIDNGTGTIKIDPAGIIDLNGVKIDPAGNITNALSLTAGAVSAGGAISADGDISTTNGDIKTTSGDVEAGTVKLKTHIHSGVTAGAANSGPPV